MLSLKSRTFSLCVILRIPKLPFLRTIFYLLDSRKSSSEVGRVFYRPDVLVDKSIESCMAGLKKLLVLSSVIYLSVSIINFIEILGPGTTTSVPFMIFRPSILTKLVDILKAGSSVVNTKTITTMTPGETNVRLLGQEEAIRIDEELFNEYKFSVDQLMELAGLSVASVIHRVYGQSHLSSRVLIITGPGNNGGDGLVAARHLKLLGFSDVVILNARKPSRELFINLLHQAEQNDVTVSYQPESFQNDPSVRLIVDALFGFSFKPPVRPDFLPFMNILNTAESKSVPVVSVDIPSGWNVENGPPSEGETFMPDTLISLTAPKLCAKYFKGQHHFLGGRFVPQKLAEKYKLNLPPYTGTDCILKL